jgi:predicted AAA+ superfamily ATPase
VTANAQVAGLLLEGFVGAELRRQLTWSERDARLFHCRDRHGVEVDLVLEADDGRVAAIEVKATAAVTARDVKWLAQLRDWLGERFVAGVVLHAGTATAPFGPRLTEAPIDIL